MTKSELIARLAERFPQLVAKDADFAVKVVLDAMTAALARGDRIESSSSAVRGEFESMRCGPAADLDPLVVKQPEEGLPGAGLLPYPANDHPYPLVAAVRNLGGSVATRRPVRDGGVSVLG